MERFVAAVLVVSVCLMLLTGAIGLFVASIFLALATVLSPWLAALTSGAICLLSAMFLIAITSRRKTGYVKTQQTTGSLATGFVRRHPLGAAGTALTAGVLVSSSERTRAAFIKSLDAYVRALSTDT
jgi:hypothetical protein